MPSENRGIIFTSAGNPPSEFMLQAMEEAERKIQSGEVKLLPMRPTWDVPNFQNFREVPHAEN